MTGKREVSDEAFTALWHQCGGHVPTIAKSLGWTERSVLRRRLKTEERLGITLPASEDRTGRTKTSLPKVGTRVVLNGFVGTIVVFSDSHWWPEQERSPAFRALVQICRDLRPSLLVANGDMFDGARVSRFPTGWAKLPNVRDELEIVHQRLSEIIEQLPPGTPKIWAMGNHDSRMAMRLAQVAPEFEGVRGLDLKDHFEDLGFEFCWSVLVNDTLFIKHRYRGGDHAAWNNTMRAGITICTGHDHRLQSTQFTDILGTRWGVCCGTLLSLGPDCPQVAYQEDNPSQAIAGFAVFTITEDGTLLPPELCMVIDGKAYFRGKVV